MNERRYDVSYGADNTSFAPFAYPDTHHCREWDEDHGGCYGTNPNHGFTWDEARKLMVEFHEQQAAEWRDKNESDFWGADLCPSH